MLLSSNWYSQCPVVCRYLLYIYQWYIHAAQSYQQFASIHFHVYRKARDDLRTYFVLVVCLNFLSRKKVFRANTKSKTFILSAFDEFSDWEILSIELEVTKIMRNKTMKNLDMQEKNDNFAVNIKK